MTAIRRRRSARPLRVSPAGKRSGDLNGFMSRFLHNHTALDLLQSLQMHGMSLVILPVRVAPIGPGAAVPDGVPEAITA